MSGPPDMMTWLRREIERDLLVATMISAGGFAPQRWDTEPPGQVNPEDITASRQVTEIIGAQHEEVAGWVQIVAYDRLNNEPPEKDCRDGTSPVILVDNGRREFEHIIRHDPRNEAARCEAALAVLDEHYILHREDRSEVYEEFSVTPHPGAEGCDYGCVTCHYRGMGSVWGKGYCRTVRLLASGYRNRPRYAAQWAP